MPQSISIELPETLVVELRAMAESQGRSLDEIALDLIEAQLHRGPGPEARPGG